MSKPIISVAEELNIFSELPVTLFDRKRNTQISDTLTRFKDIFFKYIMKNNIECPLPKLCHSVDEDSDLVKIGIKRNNVIATLYFSFEKEERESSFGFVWNDTEKLNFYTMSGNLELNDLSKVLHDMVEFLFMVSTGSKSTLPKACDITSESKRDATMTTGTAQKSEDAGLCL